MSTDGRKGTKDDPYVFVIEESVKESIIRDSFSFFTTFALIGIGVLLQSSAMQWLGAFFAFISLATRASGFKKAHTYTIKQAREKLDELEKRKSCTG